MLVIVLYHSVCYYGLWETFSPAHVVNPYNNYFYIISRVALIVFVMISGILYGRAGLKPKSKSKKEMLKSKVSRLLIPYCIWGLIAVIMCYEDNYLIHFFNGEGVQHTWFLLMLFLIYLISITFSLNKAKNIWLILIAAGCLLFSAFLPQTDGGSILSWKSVVRYMPAFVGGIFFARNDITKPLLAMKKLPYAAIYFGSFLLVAAFSVFKDNPVGLICQYIALLWWVYVSYVTIVRLTNPDKTLNPVTASLDRHSMGIYILHHLLLWGAFIFVPEVCIFLDAHIVIGPIVLFIAVLAVSWTLSYLINSNKYTRQLFNFKF